MGLIVTVIIIVHGGVGGSWVCFDKKWVSDFAGKRLKAIAKAAKPPASYSIANGQ
jgi:hypothetical protein